MNTTEGPVRQELGSRAGQLSGQELQAEAAGLVPRGRNPAPLNSDTLGNPATNTSVTASTKP